MISLSTYLFANENKLNAHTNTLIIVCVRSLLVWLVDNSDVMYFSHRMLSYIFNNLY